MSDRGRLAHSLMLRLKRPASPAGRARTPLSSARDSRSPRLLRRWGSALVELNVPRGTGASAAALLLLGSNCYGVMKGGHVPVIAGQSQGMCDAAANSIGFRISEVALSGEHEMSREDILALTGITGRSSLLFLDVAYTRTRLLTNPWIPQTAAPQLFNSLPLVGGAGAEYGAQDFLGLLRRYPLIAKSVEASVLVAERRWNLHLKSGVEVLLPEHEPGQALQTLVDLDREKNLLSRDITAVDLRLSDRVTVRQSDAAAAARDAALNAAEKDKKNKRKDAET